MSLNGWEAIQAIKRGEIVHLVEGNWFYCKNKYDAFINWGVGPNKINQLVDATSMLFSPDARFEIYKPAPEPAPPQEIVIDGKRFKLTQVE